MRKHNVLGRAAPLSFCVLKNVEEMRKLIYTSESITPALTLFLNEIQKHEYHA